MENTCGNRMCKCAFRTGASKMIKNCVTPFMDDPSFRNKSKIVILRITILIKMSLQISLSMVNHLWTLFLFLHQMAFNFWQICKSSNIKKCLLKKALQINDLTPKELIEHPYLYNFHLDCIIRKKNCALNYFWIRRSYMII